MRFLALFYFFYNPLFYCYHRPFVFMCSLIITNASRKSWFLRSACTFLPEPCRKVLSLYTFAMHVLLYCDNHRGNSHLHTCIGDLFAQLMHASLPTTKTPEPTTRLLKPVCPSLEIPIYNQHLLDASNCIALKWLMQCYASLTAKVCLESENLLRSYHSSPPPSLLSQRHRDRHTSEPWEYT